MDTLEFKEMRELIASKLNYETVADFAKAEKKRSYLMSLIYEDIDLSDIPDNADSWVATALDLFIVAEELFDCFDKSVDVELRVIE